ncbi:calreticulin-like [Rhopalosiphum maidis]|uniref:calreticulin-like n=1 Tax=Rhopalosiphum maidis TaxID=43146 RepID=UPI000EFF9F59|nr:calreticulin-like [Rhopalosiphum maidis]
MRASAKFSLCTLLCLVTALAVGAEIFFEDNFPDDSFENEWTYSEYSGKEFGKFVHSSGYFYNDFEADKGIQTTQDAKFYALSKKFSPFSNEGKNLVIQYSVKHEQNIDCGGGYIKLFNCDLEPKEMHSETPYEIMFGPDICGLATRKVHVIFSYKGKNLLINKDIRCIDDVYTHFYTLILKSDNTYEVLIDNENVEYGELEADWDFLPPKQINDPNVKKPEEWDDKPTIDDPNDEKPEDWDKPKLIPDPAATKPEDWDDEMDGEWEPAMIDNPDFKGEWKPKQIDNPNYKGVWVHPKIDNPEYKKDDKLYARKEICAIGFDLWQVKSGTIFNNILITDDIEMAKEKADAIWKPRYEGEKIMKDAIDEEESKKIKQEAKKSNDEEDGEENEELTDNDHDEL